MSRILITGAATGLGLGAADELVDRGHQVVAHARSRQRVTDELGDLLSRGAQLVTADLSDIEQLRELGRRVADIGGVDAVIHNAGVLDGPQIVPVNVIAPYVLTELIPARRLVFLSSSMHRSGRRTVDGLDPSNTGTSVSYSDSKLLVTVLAAALARIRTDVYSNSVDPGWVPTSMGGPGAPDDLELGHRTQAWLVAGEDPATEVSAYWHHQRTQRPHPAVYDPQFQTELLDSLLRLTSVRLTA